jgi:hypothetical protein
LLTLVFLVLQEIEYLFVPGSFLQRTGEDYVECTAEGPVRIIGARINANNTMRTVEQIVEQKKEMHLSTFRFCLDEMAMGLASKQSVFEQRKDSDAASKYDTASPSFKAFASKIEYEARTFLARHQKVAAADYLEEETYRAMVVEMLAAKRMAESKMELYFVDNSMLLAGVHGYSIREAHRLLMSFYRKKVGDDKIDAETRKGLAVTLCKAEGLIRTSVHEENELGEQVIIQGSADGWDHAKMWLLLHAAMMQEQTSMPLGVNSVQGILFQQRHSRVVQAQSSHLLS